MSCYIVQESDGTSRFTLEDDSGFLLLEFCPPSGAEYNPVGDKGGPIEGLPARRGRRRRLEQIEDEDILAVLMSEL